ncbi:MAG: nuclear transport factor 2 family protein [Pseudomonadota bacterium]
MTLQDTPRIRSILEMERQLGEGNWDAAGEHFTPDVQYHVGAQPPRHGIDGIRNYMARQVQLVRWDGHTPRLMLETGDTVIIEVDSHFFRHADETAFILPCTDIYRFDGERIANWRVYADLSAFHA